MIKKILITRFPYEAVFSGEEIHTLNLALKLRQKGCKIFFAGSCPVLLKEFKKHQFPVYKFFGGISLVSIKAFFAFIFTFPFIILNFLRLAFWAKFVWKIDQVYMLSLNEKLFLTPWLKLFRLKAIWVEHSRMGDWLLKNPFLFLYKFLAKNTPIITVSQKTQKQLIALGIPKKQVFFVLNGIDVKNLKKIDQKELMQWQKRKKITQVNCKKVKRIGLITRLYADKGVDYFLNALRDLVKKDSAIEVFIVGEGPCANELKKLAQDLPVIFLGKLEHTEIKYFLHSIDFFVLPSILHDPFGLAPAEAMACGKPVIVTDVCGISEFMQNKKNGLIIPAKNTKALVQALETLFENIKLSQNIALSGQKLANQKFDLERMVEDYAKIIFDL